MRQLKITKSITNRESEALDKYLQEIGKEEMISVEEEVELAQRIRKGDKIYVEGQLRYTNYTDRSGLSRTKAEIWAEKLEIFNFHNAASEK